MMTSDEVKAAIERLRSMKTADRGFIVDVCRTLLGGEVTGDELHYILIELLEQADPDTHMEVPADADGVPIHVGDVMDCGERFGVQEVDGFVHGAVAFTVFDPQPARICTCPAHMTHHHKTTVEDLLIELSNISFDVVEDDEFKELIAKYAKKIREVMADD